MVAVEMQEIIIRISVSKFLELLKGLNFQKMLPCCSFRCCVSSLPFPLVSEGTWAQGLFGIMEETGAPAAHLLREHGDWVVDIESFLVSKLEFFILSGPRLSGGAVGDRFFSPIFRSWIDGPSISDDIFLFIFRLSGKEALAVNLAWFLHC
jgi:hypothetical protein